MDTAIGRPSTSGIRLRSCHDSTASGRRARGRPRTVEHFRASAAPAIRHASEARGPGRAHRAGSFGPLPSYSRRRAMADASRSFEVLAVATRLGLTSFGGPVAHLGYFHEEYVLRRKWLDEHRYADLVALCQFLPGPASSQVGIAVGITRAG